MEQDRLSLRDVGDEGRVGATLSRPKGARSPFHGTNARGSVATGGVCSMEGRRGWAGGGGGA